MALSLAGAARIGSNLAANPQLLQNLASASPVGKIWRGAKTVARGYGRYRGMRAAAGKRVAFRRIAPINRQMGFQRRGRSGRSRFDNISSVNYSQQVAAVNQTSLTTGLSQTVTKSEPMAFGVNCEADGGGQLINFAIHPSDSRVFPTLSGLVKNYTSYQINYLVIEYRPSAGTDQDGTITMGWDQQPHNNGDEDFQNPTTVGSLPKAARGNVRSVVQFPLPKSGRKYLVVPSDTAADPLNYYHGHFAMTTVGPDHDNVGTLYANYMVTLFGPKLDTTATPLAGPLDTLATIVGGLPHTGSFSNALKLHTYKPVLLIVHSYKTGGATITLTRDDVAVAKREAVNTVSGHGIHYFYLGNVSCDEEFEIGSDATAGGWLIVECNSTHYEHFTGALAE